MSARSVFRALLRWTVRGVVTLLVLAIVVSLAGVLFQHFTARSDAKRFPPSGRVIAVEGQRLHLDCRGEGALPIVLEPGLGVPSPVWAWVRDEIGGTGRVCVYDRAGYGRSDPADGPADAVHAAGRLYALLQAADIPGPYVLVGHSIGGAYVRMFAAQHPEAVAAMVLVEASSPVGVDWSALPPRPWLGKAVMRYFAGIGGVRAALALGVADFWRDLPPQDGAAVKAFLASPKEMAALLEERDAFGDTLRQIDGLNGLGALPVAVVYSDGVVPASFGRRMDPGTAAKLREMIEKQKRYWVESSTNSRLVIIPGADHITILTREAPARALARVIMGTRESVQRQGAQP